MELDISLSVVHKEIRYQKTSLKAIENKNGLDIMFYLKTKCLSAYLTKFLSWKLIFII